MQPHATADIIEAQTVNPVCVHGLSYAETPLTSICCGFVAQLAVE